MLKIDEKTTDVTKDKDLNIEFWQKLELDGALSIPDRSIRFTSGLETYAVDIKPPYYYLGRGRTKIIVSAQVENKKLMNIIGSTRVALGLARYEKNYPHKLSGLDSFLYVAETSLPTYTWYLQSEDHNRCLMPDLSQEGTVISSNTRKLSLENRKKLKEEWEDIVYQIREMIEQTLQFDPPRNIYHDQYFVILKSSGSPRVILGDFEYKDIKFSHPSKEYLKQQAESFMEAIYGNLNFQPSFYPSL